MIIHVSNCIIVTQQLQPPVPRQQLHAGLQPRRLCAYADTWSVEFEGSLRSRAEIISLARRRFPKDMAVIDFDIYATLTRHALHLLNFRNSVAREVKLAGAFLGEENTEIMFACFLVLRAGSTAIEARKTAACARGAECPMLRGSHTGLQLLLAQQRPWRRCRRLRRLQRLQRRLLRRLQLRQQLRSGSHRGLQWQLKLNGSISTRLWRSQRGPRLGNQN